MHFSQHTIEHAIFREHSRTCSFYSIEQDMRCPQHRARHIVLQHTWEHIVLTLYYHNGSLQHLPLSWWSTPWSGNHHCMAFAANVQVAVDPSRLPETCVQSVTCLSHLVVLTSHRLITHWCEDTIILFFLFFFDSLTNKHMFCRCIKLKLMGHNTNSRSLLFRTTFLMY